MAELHPDKVPEGFMTTTQALHQEPDLPYGLILHWIRKGYVDGYKIVAPDKRRHWVIRRVLFESRVNQWKYNKQLKRRKHRVTKPRHSM